jgi:hypothetical protein
MSSYAKNVFIVYILHHHHAESDRLISTINNSWPVAKKLLNWESATLSHILVCFPKIIKKG